MKKPLPKSTLPLAVALFALSIASASGADSITNSVRLAWDPNPETDLAGYRVHRGIAPGTRLESRPAGLGTNFVWSGLVGGVTNFFTVTAYNTAGLESDPSNELSFRLPDVPLAPTGIVGVVVQVQVTTYQTVTNTFTVRP